MAHIDPPWNLLQISDQMILDYPEVSVPEGWGLSASADNVYDPAGLFTDEQIHSSAEKVAYDADYGVDPDYLWLRDSAMTHLDSLVASSNSDVSELAKWCRAFMRVMGHRFDAYLLDEPPTFP